MGKAGRMDPIPYHMKFLVHENDRVRVAFFTSDKSQDINESSFDYG